MTTTLALLIAAIFGVATAFFSWVGLEEKLEDWDWDYAFIWEHYPNPQPWEYLYIKAVSVGLGLLEFLILSTIFVGDCTWPSLIGELIVGLVIGFILAVFVSQILFLFIIDGGRYLMDQRKKCSEAIARKQQII